MDMKIKRGQILKELRIKKRLSQQNIADILKVSARAYQKYEYGTAESTFDILSKLADFYGVSTDYLLGRTPIKQMATEPNELEDIDMSEVENRIIEKYTALSEEMRAFCIDLFRQISGVVITQNGEVRHESPQRNIQISQIPQPFEKIARNGKRTILSDEEVEKLHALDDDEPPNLN